MAYIKCEPGVARGLNRTRSGVDTTFGIGSRAFAQSGEANNSTKQHFAVEPVKWSRNVGKVALVKVGPRVPKAPTLAEKFAR
jgi:hypothetical protein